ncbi:hypothetical protein IFM89_021495 [Coptis chinensis]|uniref:PPM-type phosphatase domain-containing protein n=1 Tax=Coptis chinensis TaxID=261450 RepID=A0A835H4W7_9MAGN|nr:hypothetical protein IFM89_021495 [Coptis chinensis]
MTKALLLILLTENEEKLSLPYVHMDTVQEKQLNLKTCKTLILVLAGQSLYYSMLYLVISVFVSVSIVRSSASCLNNLTMYMAQNPHRIIGICRSTLSVKHILQQIEEEFLCLVQKEWLIKPQMPTVGSCCLVGIICAGTLYIANVGKSRVVLGRSEKASMDVTAIQLSAEHDASIY